jgi:DNA primase
MRQRHLVAQIRDKSLRPEYTRLLAGWLGVEVELVTAAVNQGLKKAPQSSVNAPTEETVNTVQWRPNPTRATTYSRTRSIESAAANADLNFKLGPDRK